MDPGNERGRAYVQTGLLLIALATIASASLQLLGGARTIPVVVRTIFILITLEPVYYGRPFAHWVLGFFTLGGLLRVMIGIALAHTNPQALVIAALEGAGFLTGFVLVYCVPESRAFRAVSGRAATAASSPEPSNDR